MKKILVLDIDGVLNNNSTFHNKCDFHKVFYEKRHPLQRDDLNFHPSCISSFYKLVKAIKFDEVIISSTWRVGAKEEWFTTLFELFDIHIPSVRFTDINDTEEKHPGLRERNVINALLDYGEHFHIVLDDNRGHYRHGVLSNVVFTDMRNGFSFRELDKCLEIAKSSGIIS